MVTVERQAAPFRRPALLDDLLAGLLASEDGRRSLSSAADRAADRPGRRRRRGGPRRPAAPDGRALCHPPGGGGRHRGRAGSRRPVGGGRAAPRRRRGHRSQPRGRRAPSSVPRWRRIVDGVTKLDRLQFDSKEAQQAATVRKMLVAMANDWRVLVIKLADRLHNMRTIAVMPEWKQRRTAQETLDIYAPAGPPSRYPGAQVAAGGPGLRHPSSQALRRDRADGGHPGPRARRLPGPGAGGRAPATGRLRCRGRRDRTARSTCGASTRRWSSGARSSPRSTTWWPSGSIVDSEKDCWAALGSIHAIWSPVQGRFKDYINSPKFNLYQSLHTTVIGLEGKPIEVQIRTQEMHRRAEYGIAAHWGYKEQSKDGGASTTAEMAWLQRIVDWQQETIDPLEFLETLKLDLEQDEVYVFTPKGKVIALRGRLHAHRLRLCHPHRGRPPLHRRQGERPAGAARHEAAVGRHGRDHHLEGAVGRAVARLVADRGLAPGARTRSASGSAGNGARTRWTRAGRN